MNIDKIIAKMQNQPNGIRHEDAAKVLEYAGYHLDRQKESHMQFINQNGDVFTLKKRESSKSCLCKRNLIRN